MYFIFEREKFNILFLRVRGTVYVALCIARRTYHTHTQTYRRTTTIYKDVNENFLQVVLNMPLLQYHPLLAKLDDVHKYVRKKKEVHVIFNGERHYWKNGKIEKEKISEENKKKCININVDAQIEKNLITLLEINRDQLGDQKIADYTIDVCERNSIIDIPFTAKLNKIMLFSLSLYGKEYFDLVIYTLVNGQLCQFNFQQREHHDDHTHHRDNVLNEPIYHTGDCLTVLNNNIANCHHSLLHTVFVNDPVDFFIGVVGYSRTKLVSFAENTPTVSIVNHTDESINIIPLTLEENVLGNSSFALIARASFKKKDTVSFYVLPQPMIGNYNTLIYDPPEMRKFIKLLDDVPPIPWPVEDVDMSSELPSISGRKIMKPKKITTRRLE